MQILYFDKHAIRPGGSFRLILLQSGWHVVARGYLCQVADAEEGRRVMATLQCPQQMEDTLR
jgi:hypothetical protein